MIKFFVGVAPTFSFRISSASKLIGPARLGSDGVRRHSRNPRCPAAGRGGWPVIVDTCTSFVGDNHKGLLTTGGKPIFFANNKRNEPAN
jgi:hypothetical protein